MIVEEVYDAILCKQNENILDLVHFAPMTFGLIKYFLHITKFALANAVWYDVYISMIVEEYMSVPLVNKTIIYLNPFDLDLVASLTIDLILVYIPIS